MIRGSRNAFNNRGTKTSAPQAAAASRAATKLPRMPAEREQALRRQLSSLSMLEDGEHTP